MRLHSRRDIGDDCEFGNGVAIDDSCEIGTFTFFNKGAEMTVPVSDLAKRSTGLCELLERRTFSASAPCRIDCGNTLDIRPLALLLQSIKPVTVNIALELRTKVELLPFENGYTKISSPGFPSREFRLADAPLDSSVGLVAAILYHFHVDGVHVQVKSESPPRSGLGGSGVLAVCVIAALTEALADLGHPRLSRIQQVCLAQNIEEGLGTSRSGLQDQAAAMFGGVNQWVWDYRRLHQPFERIQLIRARQYGQLAKHILVAYTGTTHGPSGLTQEWLDDFTSGRIRRSEWRQIREATVCFANALRAGEWGVAANYLREECQTRVQLWTSVLDAAGRQLVQAATNLDCGARFCGGGGGGCIWAIGEEQRIVDLRREWGMMLADTSGGRLLDAKVASRGVVIRSGHR
jgi:D-glycero-alpha-D-manno-heptose-7-phosphate kinase